MNKNQMQKDKENVQKELNDAVWIWFQRTCDLNVSIAGPLMHRLNICGRIG